MSESYQSIGRLSLYAGELPRYLMTFGRCDDDGDYDDDGQKMSGQTVRGSDDNDDTMISGQSVGRFDDSGECD